MIPPVLVGPAIGVAVVLAGLGWLRLVHDPAVRAAQVAEIAAVVAQERERQHQAATAALEAQAVAQAALDAALTQTRRRIANAAPTACAVAPDGLRAAILREPRPARAGPP